MQTQIAIGTHIYLRAHTLETESVFEGLVECGRAAAAPTNVPFYLTFGPTGLARPPRAIGDDKTLLRAWRKHENIGVALTSYDTTGELPEHTDRAEVHIQRRRPPEEESASGPRYADYAVLKEAQLTEVDERQFIDAALHAFEIADGACGLIHVASMNIYLRNDVGIARATAANREHIEVTRLRRMLLDPFEQRLGEFLPGAFWGVMLGREMVERLGGIERIDREAPVLHTRHLANGGMYLQATRRPVPLTDPALQAALPNLEEYLEPISAPIGPYFRGILGKAQTP